MNSRKADHAAETLPALYEQLISLRREIVGDGEEILQSLTAGQPVPEHHRASLVNLSHYLALRRRDLRSLQRQLMSRGLSSLGRLESRVLPTLDAVATTLAAMQPMELPFDAPSTEVFFAGEGLLDEATDTLFGPPRGHRRGRIMVTLPGEAADQPDFILDLAKRGMDIARINCAHDDEAAWVAMTGHVRAAGQAIGRELTVLMDIAGPKIRTEAVVARTKAKLQTGDLLKLVSADEPVLTDGIDFCAAVSLPEIVSRVAVGHRMLYNDGKLEGVIESVAEGEALLRVSQVKAGGVKLKSGKGLNLPDTQLGISPLTSKDHSDLAKVVGNADMVGYSFVSRPEDIALLEDTLKILPAREKPLAVIAKIEQPEAVKNLPALIASARCHDRPFGVMIARGDLAAEIGFERVAEMQEEILWICEAAAVPTIWATQVLEDLVKDGLPSRGEMTDAAMAARAECVMLNKGPEVGQAVSLLDSLLARMDGHLFKKTPTLRQLKSW